MSAVLTHTRRVSCPGTVLHCPRAVSDMLNDILRGTMGGGGGGQAGVAGVGKGRGGYGSVWQGRQGIAG
jgi:hypothetical protein